MDGLRNNLNPQSTIHNPQSPGGQSTLEYALFIAVVTAALVAMTVYVRRSIQANLKTLEGQINGEALL